MSVKLEGLVVHLESTLGRIECGWARTEPSRHLPVRVARFSDTPVTGLATFATLGLSNHELTQSSGRPIRAELVLSCWNRYRDTEVPAILDLVAEDLMDSGILPSRGSVVSNISKVTKSGSMKTISGPLTRSRCTMSITNHQSSQSGNSQSASITSMLLLMIRRRRFHMPSCGWLT